MRNIVQRLERISRRSFLGLLALTLVANQFIFMAPIFADDPESATVSGRVSELSIPILSGAGAGIEDVTVEARFAGTNTVAGSTSTNSNGDYTVTSLPLDYYDLHLIFPDPMPAPSSGTRYYDFGDQSYFIGGDHKVIPNVDARSGAVLGRDYKIHPVSTISGQVTNSNGSPAASKAVTCAIPITATCGWNTVTDANGNYSLPTYPYHDYTIMSNGYSISGVDVSSVDMTLNLGPPLQIDSTPPEISYNLSLPSNEDGWHVTPTTITWSVADPETAIDSQTGCGETFVSSDTAGITHTCTATSVGGIASESVTVKYDATAPALGTYAWTGNPKATDQTSTLTVPVTDSTSGVAGGEYFIGDTDPGQGNGATMGWDGVNLSTTFGTDFPTGVYKISFRAQDNAGNWSEPLSDYLVVYDPTGFRLTGKRAVTPSLVNGDVLPGLINSNQTDKATFGFNVRYNNQGTISNNSDFQFTYKTGKKCNGNNPENCHAMNLNATNIAWFATQGTNNSEGHFQGTADMVLDSVSSSVPFRVTGLDGTRLSPTSSDHFTLLVYATGANPATDAPVYQVSADVTRGNVRVIDL